MLFETSSIGYGFHVERESSDTLTAKGKYALKALIYLSTLEPGEKAQGLPYPRRAIFQRNFSMPF